MIHLRHRTHPGRRSPAGKLIGSPNAANKPGSWNAVIAAIRSPLIRNTVIANARYSRRSTVVQPASAGAPFALVGAVRNRPTKSGEPGSQLRLSAAMFASRPANHPGYGGIVAR